MADENQAGDVTRAELLASGRVKVKALENPPEPFEGRQFYVQRLSGACRDEWDIWRIGCSWSDEDAKAGRGQLGRYKPGTTFRAKFVALTQCDANGKLLFNPHNAADVAQLAALDGELLDWLFDEAREFNGIRPADEAEAAKNSGQVGSEDTGSNSPTAKESQSPSVNESSTPPSSPNGKSPLTD